MLFLEFFWGVSPACNNFTKYHNTYVSLLGYDAGLHIKYRLNVMILIVPARSDLKSLNPFVILSNILPALSLFPPIITMPENGGSTKYF